MLNGKSSLAQAKATPVAFLQGMGTFLRYLLAFDALFFAFLLGARTEGADNLALLVGAGGQVLIVSAMLFGNMADTAKENARRYRLLNWVLLISSFIAIWYQFQLTN